MEPLDNPIWHALTGPQANVAERIGDAVRFDPRYSIFGGLPDHTTAQDWSDLASVVGPGSGIVLFCAGGVGDGWQQLGDFGVHQMVGSDLPAIADPAGTVKLGAKDATEMAELVATTEPGPWAVRTHELGEFIGVRMDGRLIAMVGQRMQLPGAVEISAVCTAPEYRGRGLAARLTALMAHRITAAGAIPILHVREDNDSAIRAYRRAGFVRRTTLRPGMYLAPGDPPD